MGAVGSRPVIWAVRRYSKTGLVEGVWREESRVEIVGSSWFIT